MLNTLLTFWMPTHSAHRLRWGRNSVTLWIVCVAILTVVTGAVYGCQTPGSNGVEEGESGAEDLKKQIATVKYERTPLGDQYDHQIWKAELFEDGTRCTSAVAPRRTPPGSASPDFRQSELDHQAGPALSEEQLTQLVSLRKKLVSPNAPIDYGHIQGFPEVSPVAYITHSTRLTVNFSSEWLAQREYDLRSDWSYENVQGEYEWAIVRWLKGLVDGECKPSSLESVELFPESEPLLEQYLDNAR